MARDPMLSSQLLGAEREALIKFHDQVDERGALVPWSDANVSIGEIVEHGRTMQQIREVANECLRTLGVTFTTEELTID